MDDDDRRAQIDHDRLAIPLDPEAALRALLKVDPDAKPTSGRDRNGEGTGESVQEKEAAP